MQVCNDCHWSQARQSLWCNRAWLGKRKETACCIFCHDHCIEGTCLSNLSPAHLCTARRQVLHDIIFNFTCYLSRSHDDSKRTHCPAGGARCYVQVVLRPLLPQPHWLQEKHYTQMQQLRKSMHTFADGLGFAMSKIKLEW